MSTALSLIGVIAKSGFAGRAQRLNCWDLLRRRSRLTISQFSSDSTTIKTVRTKSSAMASSVDQSKKLAAFKAIDDHLKDNQVVGIGSGSTIVYAVERLAQRVAAEQLKVVCVPTSYQAIQLIRQHSLIQSDLTANPVLDIAFDGADEVDSNLVLIKGGGGCHTQEKVVAAAANQLIVVADYRKDSVNLGDNWNYVPVEVLPLAHETVKRRIESKFGGNCELRMGKSKAGPVVTDNGQFILDWHFPKQSGSQSVNWREINRDLNEIAGVFETGIFAGYATHAYFGNEDGSVTVRTVNN